MCPCPPFQTRQPEMHAFRLSVAFPVLCLLVLLMSSCTDLPIDDDLSDSSYRFVLETGDSVSFPRSFAGKILVVSYIYTHCPDVCVLTTSNMELLHNKIGRNEDILFLSVSIDPRRDSPQVLREYADVRGIDTTTWHFLTGPLSVTDSLLERVGFYYRRSFIERAKNGEEVYFLDHSDFISLFDTRGRLRGEYKGTSLNIDEIAKDIRTIAGEPQ